MICSYLDIFSTICDVIGCWNEGIYEKEVTVLDTLNVPFTLTTYVCEMRGDSYVHFQVNKRLKTCEVRRWLKHSREAYEQFDLRPKSNHIRFWLREPRANDRLLCRKKFASLSEFFTLSPKRVSGVHIFVKKVSHTINRK